ncbi:MAG: hypothetical protein A2909_00890 [Candidatus Tagabacteria bacterium RIFCSPLOWO2_01_FULL_39_11]|uniref:Capsule polysaccharide biosynthesis protein n=1 Tax=Candidatus Tagabacteria bacterium RIFCSPLOWO2_01_FULL_39_11 TaxID=1802295 RepID=A0A1G2LQL4_9BACT|nr:MAG: hypothetical protein A2909_00890 [Candidatus Tagabacteria bacterium RIFCSPLOWO2_01_FULL_39_11]
MKRIFLIGWSVDDGLGLAEVAKELQKQSHKIAYWTYTGAGAETIINEKEFPGVIKHSHEDAIAGLPAKGVDISHFLPPGEDLIAKLYETESAVLSMMNKKYKDIGVSERKQIYFDLVRYWYGVIQALKPDVVIYSDIPHTVYDFIIFSICELLNIKTVMFERVVQFDRMLLMNDYKIGSRSLEKALRDNRGKQSVLADLREDMQRHYQEQLSDMVPRNIQKLKKNYIGKKAIFIKIRMIWDSFIDFTFFRKAFNFIFKIFQENLKIEYESAALPADFMKPFIYVPLNYQPERTSNPQGGIFDNQILMIEILAASLPSNWLIYVKEHPTQWLPRGLNFFNYRYQGFYKSIARIPNVRLVPMATNTHELIRNCQALATVTGTAGWEALMRAKPVLVFGFPWYKEYYGIFKIKNVADCKNAIAEIQQGFKASPELMFNYLAALDQANVRAYFDLVGKELSGISREENVENLSRLILPELETAPF